MKDYLYRPPGTPLKPGARTGNVDVSLATRKASCQIWFWCITLRSLPLPHLAEDPVRYLPTSALEEIQLQVRGSVEAGLKSLQQQQQQHSKSLLFKHISKSKIIITFVYSDKKKGIVMSRAPPERLFSASQLHSSQSAVLRLPSPSHCCQCHATSSALTRTLKG